MKRPLAVLAVLAALLAPAAAQAHATLDSSSPQRGAVVAREPARVALRFDEPVEAQFGAVRVFDARGARVDDGKVRADGPRVSVGLRPRLADGTYTLTYRVISADSHPVGAGLTFSIGRAGAAPAQSVTDLLGRAEAGPVTSTAFTAVRALDYLAIALGAGGVLFLLAVWRPALAEAAGAEGRWIAAADAFAGRARAGLVVAAGLGVATSGAGIVLQGATAGATSAWAAADPTVVREVLDTRFGEVWGVRLVVWIVLGGAALLPASRGQALVRLHAAQLGATGSVVAPLRVVPAVILGAAATALVVSPALASHATTQSPVWALAPLDIVHVGAMSAWLAGLAAILFAVGAATRTLEPADRTRLLAAVLRRFSAIALAAVVALTVTGTVQAIFHIDHFIALVGTGYGRAVLIKVVLLLALIGLGARNRRRTVPELERLAAGGGTPGAAGHVLRRTLRAEVAIVLAVLVVTGALVSYAPPSVAAGAGPFSKDFALGPLRAELTVDPARAGLNEAHLYLFRADGAPFAGTKEIRVQASLEARGIGPITVPMRRAGPGHFVADATQLAPSGGWTVAVDDRVSDFDEYSAKIEVPIR